MPLLKNIRMAIFNYFIYVDAPDGDIIEFRYLIKLSIARLRFSIASSSPDSTASTIQCSK